MQQIILLETHSLVLAIFIVNLCINLFKFINLSSFKIFSFLVLLMLLLNLPINYPLSYYSRGVIGDFSITSLVLALAYLFNKMELLKCNKQIEQSFNLFAILGILFYALSLSIIMNFDFYELGYSYFGGVIILLLALYGILQLNYIVIISVSLSFIGYYLGFLESHNIFDYLIDANLWLLSCFIMFVKLIKNTRIGNASN